MSEHFKTPNWFNKLPVVYKLIISVILAGVCSLFFSSVRMEPVTRIMIGWDIASFLIIFMSIVTFSTMSPRQIRVLAKIEDASRIIVFSIVLITAVCSLLGVFILLGNKDGGMLGRKWETFIYLSGVSCSWLLLHSIFTYRYAHLYYGDHPTLPDENTVALIFPRELWPDYLDFAYFSFVIGMTFQVSDVQITSRSIRRFALLHGLLSFLFNTVIVALTINAIIDLKN